MKIMLAGTYTRPPDKVPSVGRAKYMLESFYYFSEWQIPFIKKCDMFLLDSGAFTFMNNSKQTDFDNYLEEYIKFINKYNVEYFFELDIDNIVGYAKVKEMRERLERKTGKKCIPVWHRKRGLEDFVETTKKYAYIAIGGIVTKEIRKEEYPVFTELIKIAHKNNCKVHGLGFTSCENLQKYHFDSVDSSSWLSASRFGQLNTFKNGRMITTKPPKGKKTIHYLEIDEYNVQQWLKFQQYADKYL